MSIKSDIESLLQEGVKQQHFPGAQYMVVYRSGETITGFVGNRFRDD